MKGTWRKKFLTVMDRILEDRNETGQEEKEERLELIRERRNPPASSGAGRAKNN